MNAELCKWEMADPVKILMSREAAAEKRTCAGCRHAKEVADPFGGVVMRCLKGRPHGKKCHKFEVNR
ncbi:hypothetical protein CEG14_05645 [Bordetella genomosp. 1]|uniref:Uncharacterized protein n=1 Tax=Bordetella genomosp. 1 TaxID=1395607 RepID=A0A261SNR1_9BORD|nr:hypothetical protein [Bordetella genomosp. 1]OZI39019.1 hypothetical protein CEG14_05645 [Bordetella genomosp. 1]